MPPYSNKKGINIEWVKSNHAAARNISPKVKN